MLGTFKFYHLMNVGYNNVWMICSQEFAAQLSIFDSNSGTFRDSIHYVDYHLFRTDSFTSEVRISGISQCYHHQCNHHGEQKLKQYKRTTLNVKLISSRNKETWYTFNAVHQSIQLEQKDLRIWRTFYERRVLKMLYNCWSWQNFCSIYIDALTLKL